MVLWPGCEGRARVSLHTKNVRSVWFVALIVWFIMNGMCAKNKNICMWHEQAIIEWSRRVISIVACCRGAKLCAHAAQDVRSQHYHFFFENYGLKTINLIILQKIFFCPYSACTDLTLYVPRSLLAWAKRELLLLLPLLCRVNAHACRAQCFTQAEGNYRDCTHIPTFI